MILRQFPTKPFVSAGNVILLMLGCLLLSTTAQAAVIEPTAGPHTVQFSAEEVMVHDEGSGYSAVVQVESRLTVGMLVGEPVYTCLASWKLLSVAAGDDGFEAELTGASERAFSATRLPPAVLQEITLYDVDLAYPLAPELPIDSSSMFLCDAGILTTAGTGKPSFNFPSSPLWRELFWNALTERHKHPDRAKELYVDMLAAYAQRATENSGSMPSGGLTARTWNSSVHAASINLWPVKRWLGNLLRKKAETARREAEAFEQKNVLLVGQGGKVADDAFDAFMTTVYQKQEANQVVARLDAENTTKPKSAGLTRAQRVSDLPNTSCGSRERLSELNGGWDAGAKMQEIVGGCAISRPESTPNQSFGLKLTPRKY